MSRALLVLLLLTATYALMLGSVDPWDLLFGALFAGAMLVAFRRFLFVGRPVGPLVLLRRALAFVPFVGAVLGDIVVGTWWVTLVVLHLRPLSRPGIVAVPIGERTRVGVAVSALATTLSPGSYLVDVDWERRVMLYHVLDASDPDAVEAAQQRFYRRYQRHVFP